MVCDHHLFPRPCLFLHQATPLPFLPPLGKTRFEVPAIDGLVRHRHFILGAPGLRSVTLLQDHDCVLCVVVRKVNTEVGPI